ncbi:MAG: cupin domain-containing protein [Dehalococcoidales bacterium]|nr:cupin domain-containing protein [Dehalococcoidales bacterium]
MKVQNYRGVKEIKAAPGVTMRVVAGPDDGAPNFAMRVFEIESGFATPLHTHPWEHEVFVLAGKGVLRGGGRETQLEEGDAVLVLPNEPHSFLGTGKGVFRLICVVPLVGGKMPGMPGSQS